MVALFWNNPVLAQQYSNSGYHIDHSAQKSTQSDLPSICDHMHTLIRHHDYEQVHELIIETIKDDPIQPDCFFHNARLYFSHKLSGRDKHSKYLFDSLLVLYDKWFASSRNPTEVLNFKGRDVRDYYYKQPDSLRKYCALYKRIYDADRESLHPYNLKMMAFCACDLYGKVNIDTLWEFTRAKAAAHHEHLWKAPFRSLKRELIKCPKMGCNQLNGYLHPELTSGNESPEENQKVARLLSDKGCATPEGFTLSKQIPDPEAIKKKEITRPAPVVVKVAPLSVYENMMKTARSEMSKKKFNDAMHTFSLAVENAPSPIEKADSYMGMAIAADSLKDFKKAKELGKLIHQLLPDEMDGIKFLSKLYQKGEHECDFLTAREQAAYYVLLSKLAWSLSNSEESDAWKENANLNELYSSGQAKKGDKIFLGCFIEEEVELP